jgi:hypothetical protein
VRLVGNGLFALQPEIDAEQRKSLPQSCQTPVRLILSVEVWAVTGGDPPRWRG